jgi:hypothetical protein
VWIFEKRKWGFRRIANFEVELIASDQGTGKWTETRRQLKENPAHTERIFLVSPDHQDHRTHRP